MNASTLTTRTNLIDLSTVLPSGDFYVPPYLEVARDSSTWNAILTEAVNGTRDYRYGWRLRAAQVWNEAQIENAHADALALNKLHAAPPMFAPVEDRAAQADAIATMRRREAQIARELEAAQVTARELRAQVSRLQEPVTRGDDDRLIEFWGLAADAADEAGFCPEYDRIAEMMGGVPRETEIEYSVELTITTSVTLNVTAGRNFDPNENLRDYVDLYSIQQQADVSWSDIEIDDYNRS